VAHFLASQAAKTTRIEMITKTFKAASAIRTLTGNGSVIFNDRLVDGKRSLKVWGWTYAEYLQTAQILERQGCKVEFVQVPVGTRGKRWRLHVVE
jgi:hypothetical protein